MIQYFFDIFPVDENRVWKRPKNYYAFSEFFCHTFAASFPVFVILILVMRNIVIGYDLLQSFESQKLEPFHNIDILFHSYLGIESALPRFKFFPSKI